MYVRKDENAGVVRGRVSVRRDEGAVVVRGTKARRLTCVIARGS